MKLVMVLMLLAVVAALVSAGAFMLRKRESETSGEQDRRMARALALRVGLSVALFLIVLVGWWLGWVKPGGLPAGR